MPKRERETENVIWGILAVDAIYSYVLMNSIWISDTSDKDGTNVYLNIWWDLKQGFMVIMVAAQVIPISKLLFFDDGKINP